PRIFAIVSSTLKYRGNPRWTNAPSGPFGNGKWSLKTKLKMLNTITATTSPVAVRYTTRSRFVSGPVAWVVTTSSLSPRSVLSLGGKRSAVDDAGGRVPTVWIQTLTLRILAQAAVEGRASPLEIGE